MEPTPKFIYITQVIKFINIFSSDNSYQLDRKLCFLSQYTYFTEITVPIFFHINFKFQGNVTELYF